MSCDVGGLYGCLVMLEGYVYGCLVMCVGVTMCVSSIPSISDVCVHVHLDHRCELFPAF